MKNKQEIGVGFMSHIQPDEMFGIFHTSHLHLLNFLKIKKRRNMSALILTTEITAKVQPHYTTID